MAFHFKVTHITNSHGKLLTGSDQHQSIEGQTDQIQIIIFNALMLLVGCQEEHMAHKD